MELTLYWIDAFTDRPFAGNPAAVVPLTKWLPDPVMQQMAFEHGLAETAFVVRTDPAAPRFHLRWFTPKTEVDLCGHATLATAHVLFRELAEPEDQLMFQSRSGPLIVRKRGDGKLELDFPVTPVAVETDAAVARNITAALGTTPVWLGRSRFDRFAVLAAINDVRDLEPDLSQVAAAGGRGLIVTAGGDETCDFVSRFFAPQSGVPEDPATGSAHCALMSYWAARLGRPRLRARQLSPRGADLDCELAGDRVRIAGDTVLYLRGVVTV
jgi:PhzF family phenazine biosynthesis protein